MRVAREGREGKGKGREVDEKGWARSADGVGELDAGAVGSRTELPVEERRVEMDGQGKVEMDGEEIRTETDMRGKAKSAVHEIVAELE